MPQLTENFDQRLLSHAERALENALRCHNEESVKLFLVLPFLALLGYDPGNPCEISPEHRANLRGGQQGRVDFAILREDQPVIAIECKAPGVPLDQGQAQLRAYFEAGSGIKVGILTDGLLWRFFADVLAPGAMDETPFLEIDLRLIARGGAATRACLLLARLRRDTFDTAQIAIEARQAHIRHTALKELAAMAVGADPDICRILLRRIGLKGLRGQAFVQARTIIAAAIRDYFQSAESIRKDAPCAPATNNERIAGPLATLIRQRLAFLIEDEDSLSRIADVDIQEHRGKMMIFYRRERRGLIAEYTRLAQPSGFIKHRFCFPAEFFAPGESAEIVIEGKLDLVALGKLDAPLLKVFRLQLRASQRALRRALSLHANRKTPDSSYGGGMTGAFQPAWRLPRARVAPQVEQSELRLMAIERKAVPCPS